MGSRYNKAYQPVKESDTKTYKSWKEECNSRDSTQPTIVELPKETWTGQLNDEGRPEGAGVYTYVNATLLKYEGEMKNGRREGQGTLYYKDGSKIEGEWKNGQANGKCRAFSKGGLFYEGNLKDSAQDGHGIYYYNNGDKYEGIFKNKNKHGYGIYYYTNGNRYEGNWQDNEEEGHGVFYWPDGSTYDGDFEAGQRDGFGILTVISPTTKEVTGRYEGKWKDGKKHGEGLATNYFSNGSVEICRGTWKNGKRHGYCKVEVIENGQREVFFEGFYEDGYAVRKS
jgi:hypothetical protein